MKSITVYNQYELPDYRIDYQGRGHGVGTPHIHIYSYGEIDGTLYRVNETVLPYHPIV